MRFNRHGQSILENVITVTLVSLGIVLSWDLSSQLTGGGIKNLVSWLEEPNPHKYIIQAPPGGGISVPGCDCDPWSPPVCDTTGTNCGATGPRMLHQFRNCYPPGCESTIEPPIQTQRCIFDSSCCTTPSLINGIASCGPQASCPDDLGMATWQCGNNPPQSGCQPFPQCRFNCTNFNGSQMAWCHSPPPPRPPSNDHAGLTGNTPRNIVSGPSQCANDPPKCKAYCTGLFRHNPLTNNCDPCPNMINLTAPYATIGDTGMVRWRTAWIDITEFDFSTVPRSIVELRSNIQRISFDVREVENNGWNTFNLMDIEVTFDGVTTSYWDAQMSPQFSNPSAYKFRVTDNVQNYISQNTTNPNDCNPTYIRNIMWNYSPRIPNDNHSENFTAKAIFDPNNRLLGIRIYSCSADDGGSAGFRHARIGAHIFLNSCQGP